MKLLILILIIASFCNFSNTQLYPFQDTGLPEDRRIRNLISLMTLDEKLSCLSTRISIPHPEVTGTRTIEGLHGLAQTWDPDLIRMVADREADEARYQAQNENYKSAG